MRRKCLYLVQTNSKTTINPCIYWIHITQMKDAGFRIRMPRELLEAFLAACKEHDKSAAQVIREYMRLYVEQNASEDEVAAGTGNQPGLSKK